MSICKNTLFAWRSVSKCTYLKNCETPWSWRDFAKMLEFCSWLNAHYQLHRYITFTDEAQLNREGVRNIILTCGHMRLLLPPWKVTCSSGWWGGWSVHLRRSSYRSVWAYLWFPREELPQLLKEAMYSQWQSASFSCAVRNFINDRFAVWWIGRGDSHNWPARSRDLKDCWIFLYWDGWKKWYTAWNFGSETDCLVVFWMDRRHQKQSAAVETSSTRFLQMEQRDAFRLRVGFSKTWFKHRSA